MHALAHDCLCDFCRVARRYAASVTATVSSGSSHSSGRREHIGKDILRQGVLLVASPVAVLAEPALEHTHSGTHLPQLLTCLTPIATRHVLAVVPADTNLIGATAGVTETAIGERMGAVNPPCACPLLSACCLRESQAPFARYPSSQGTTHGAIETPRSCGMRICAARGARGAWRGAM